MAMVVQHNLTAMNANRQLGITTGAQAKSSEKLSSGYRINRAGDDAAGLKISEKMRSQIRGLDKASDNAQDGISLIQTAEGALNEAHSILQRMNELAVQGANDTNQSIDRDAINQELEALTDELDRISQTTQFNKQNLLDGNFKEKKLQVGANANQNIEISIDSMNADALGLGKEQVKQGGTTPTAVKYQGMTYTYEAGKTAAANKTAAITQFKASIAQKTTKDDFTAQYDNTTGSVYYKATIDGKEKKFDSADKALASYVADQQKIAEKAINEDFQKYVQTKDTEATTNATGETRYGARVDDYKAANETINKVSTQRSALGALQNRLEHTVANLDNVSENTSSAESRIRDTDMAEEMVNYSKNNILAQAGQSMLAQANQSTQGVLSLLQ